MICLVPASLLWWFADRGGFCILVSIKWELSLIETICLTEPQFLIDWQRSCWTWTSNGLDLMVHAIKLSLTWRAVGFAICLRGETLWFSLSWCFCFFPSRGLVSAFGDQLTRFCLYGPQRMGRESEEHCLLKMQGFFLFFLISGFTYRIWIVYSRQSWGHH